MLFVLSPAKSLDFETPAPALDTTAPAFGRDAAQLVEILRSYAPSGLAGLMHLSDTLAALNVARYAQWRPRTTPRNSKPAVLAFDGDVYGGLDARTLDPAALGWAQDHLRILSGLYGVLRPLDRLQPYRLEMGTRLPNPAGKDLYHFWGPRIAQALDRQAASCGARVLVNLASEEYFRAVDRTALRMPVIDCVFEDWKAGRYRIISFHAKRARGLMARHAIVQRAKEVRALKTFQAEGWRFDPAASEAQRLVFRRRLPEVASQ